MVRTARRYTGARNFTNAPAALDGLEQDKIVNEYKEVIAEIDVTSSIFWRAPERVAVIVGEELTAIKLVWCQQSGPTPQRDRVQRTRAGHRGSHHTREHGGDVVSTRVTSEPAPERVPCAEAWWSRKLAALNEG